MSKLTLLPYNLPGKIYRSPLPFSSMFDRLEEVWPAYKTAGIQTVVMLLSEQEASQHSGRDIRQLYEQNGLQVISSPVEDFSAPPHGSFDAAIQQVIRLAQQGQAIAIHCHAGIGRTGMFAACLARELWGWNSDDAIAWVRQFIPQAVESDFQVRFVEEYQPSGKHNPAENKT